MHEEFEQVIVDFNLAEGSFTFIDRGDLQLKNHETLDNLAKFLILSGSFYGKTELQINKSQTELFEELEKACDPDTAGSSRDSILVPTDTPNVANAILF